MTLGLACINLAVFVLISWQGPGLAGQLMLSPITQSLGDGVLATGFADGAWWQPLTSAFTQIYWWHLVTNLVVLWVLGQQVEERIGAIRMLAIYLAGALLGSAAVLWLGARNEVVTGASGAIYALFGVLVVWAIRRRVNLLLIIAIVAVNVYASVSIPQISWQAHLGGLLAGLGAGLWMKFPDSRRNSRRIARVRA